MCTHYDVAKPSNSYPYGTFSVPPEWAVGVCKRVVPGLLKFQADNGVLPEKQEPRFPTTDAQALACHLAGMFPDERSAVEVLSLRAWLAIYMAKFGEVPLAAGGPASVTAEDIAAEDRARILAVSA